MNDLRAHLKIFHIFIFDELNDRFNYFYLTLYYYVSAYILTGHKINIVLLSTIQS